MLPTSDRAATALDSINRFELFDRSGPSGYVQRLDDGNWKAITVTRGKRHATLVSERTAKRLLASSRRRSVRAGHNLRIRPRG